jgi:hypothetical protein
MRKRKIYLSDDLRVFSFPGTHVTPELASTLEAWISRLNEKDKEGLQRLVAEAGKAGGMYPDWDKGHAALVELSMRKLEERRGEIPEAAAERKGRPRLPKRKFKWLLSCWMNKARRHLLLDWQAMCGAETDGVAMLVWMDLLAADGVFGGQAPRIPRECTFDMRERLGRFEDEVKRQAEDFSTRLNAQASA